VETERDHSLNSVGRLAALARLRLCELWGKWPIVVKGESRGRGRVRVLGLVEVGTTQLHSQEPSASVLYHIMIGCICGSRPFSNNASEYPRVRLTSTADEGGGFNHRGSVRLSTVAGLLPRG